MKRLPTIRVAVVLELDDEDQRRLELNSLERPMRARFQGEDRELIGLATRMWNEARNEAFKERGGGI